MRSKQLAIGGLAIGLVAGGLFGLVLGATGSSSAQTTPTTVAAAPTAGADKGTFTPNTDPAHEAAETPQHEADEKSGKFHGGHDGGRSNHDAAHEAAEDPARVAEEAARDAALPADSTVTTAAPKAA